MNNIRPFFSGPISFITVNSAAVYGVTYLGRVYLQINPLRAALFSLGYYLTIQLTAEITRKIINSGRRSETNWRVGYAVIYVGEPIAIAVALASGAYSILQVITALGLMRLCEYQYNYLLARNIPIDKLVPPIDDEITDDEVIDDQESPVYRSQPNRDVDRKNAIAI